MARVIGHSGTLNWLSTKSAPRLALKCTATTAVDHSDESPDDSKVHIELFATMVRVNNSLIVPRACAHHLNGCVHSNATQRRRRRQR